MKVSGLKMPATLLAAYFVLNSSVVFGSQNKAVSESKESQSVTRIDNESCGVDACKRTQGVVFDFGNMQKNSTKQESEKPLTLEKQGLAESFVSTAREIMEYFKIKTGDAVRNFYYSLSDTGTYIAEKLKAPDGKAARENLTGSADQTPSLSK